MEERHDPARRGLVVAAGAEDLAAMNRPWNPGIRGSAERLRRVNADRLFDGLFALVLVCSGALLLYLARHGTFVADEWTFIGERMTPSLDTWLRPHNEHLSLLPVVAYELLFAAFGLATHLPYTALLILLHMLACAGVYRAITLLSGRSAAFAAATRRVRRNSSSGTEQASTLGGRSLGLAWRNIRVATWRVASGPSGRALRSLAHSLFARWHAAVCRRDLVRRSAEADSIAENAGFRVHAAQRANA